MLPGPKGPAILRELHWKNILKHNISTWKKCLCVASTVLFLSGIQYVWFGLIMKLWAPNKTPPDRTTCDCTCWDTVFKGSYVKNLGGYYLHLYFNVTPQTLKIWTITVLMIITVYEVISFIIKLGIQRKIRPVMLFLLLASIHSHYYTWWVLVGYLNDDFYKYWNHQLLFSFTEMLGSAAILQMMNSDKKLNENLLLVVLTVSIFHILMGGIDQFVINIIFGRGQWHQRSRDIAFMATDLINFAVMVVLIFLRRRSLNGIESTGLMRFPHKLLICTISVIFLISFTKIL